MRLAGGTSYTRLLSRPSVSHRRARTTAVAPQAVFTGIVQGQAQVRDVQHKGESSRVCLQFPEQRLQGIQVGASVAINGTCLTITDVQQDTGYFDIIAETLRATNLGSELQTGKTINFERSARVGDEIGGHNVAGHVHTTAEIASIQDTPDNRAFTFKVPGQWMKYIFAKGFIAVDGISLTVGEVTPGGFCVYLIPETLRVTTMGAKQVGNTVNLEIEAQTQAIVDTVEKVVAAHMQQRDAEQAWNQGSTADLSSGLPRAYGNTAAEHGHEPAEEKSPQYA